MKKQFVRSLSFLFCLSSALISCGGQSIPSVNNGNNFSFLENEGDVSVGSSSNWFDFLSSDDFFEDKGFDHYLEHYEEHREINGTKIVVFGRYGYD